MKSFVPVFIAAIFCSTPNKAQQKYKIGFAKEKDTVLRYKGEERLVSIEVTAANNTDTFKDHILDIAVEKASTIPQNDYEVISSVSGSSLTALKDKGNFIRILLRKDDPDDAQVKPLKLILKLSVKMKKDGKEVADEASNNESTSIQTALVVLPPDKPLTSYRFLGYLGTNFDLVDGIKAQNLFFATNIFIPETKRIGFSLGVYGNRTMTSTDSARDIIFTSKIARIGRDSLAYYRDSAMKVVSQVSDNIGAHFTPLIRLGFFKEGNLKLYYAPQFEFIWRRTVRETSYLNNHNFRIDSTTSRFPAGASLPLITPLRFKTNANVYDAYLGLIGLLLRYETEEISIRVSSSVGINFNYTPIGSLSTTGEKETVNQVYNKDTRFFFFTRLWITEPTTGLTLGAEVSNYFGYTNSEPRVSKAQPFYNVTLSKAFNLKDLASVVKPLSTR